MEAGCLGGGTYRLVYIMLFLLPILYAQRHSLFLCFCKVYMYLLAMLKTEMPLVEHTISTISVAATYILLTSYCSCMRFSSTHD